ncbi:MAG: hypothetical protein J5809_08770 [Selenomonadaceae bacterium]|nr:hypothetical protein [Selenomonadaceae bacterium]
MKKFLAAAVLAFSLFQSPMAEAELIYTGVQEESMYQGKRVLLKHYIDTNGIIENKYSFSVDVVSEVVGLNVYQGAVPFDFVYKNGEWRRAISNSYDREIKNFDAAVWNAAAPYVEKIKAKIIARVNKQAAPVSNVSNVDTSELIAQADAKYKAKDYTAARQLFAQAVAQNPNDYHAHDLYARSIYRDKADKNKDYGKIAAEIETAVNLAPNNEAKADCLMFLSKVYQNLGMKDLFNANKKIDYVAMSNQCQKMAQQLRAGAKASNISVPKPAASSAASSSQEIFVGYIDKKQAFLLPNTVKFTGSKISPDLISGQVKIVDADDNAKTLTFYFKYASGPYNWSLKKDAPDSQWYKVGTGGGDSRTNKAISALCTNMRQICLEGVR